MLNHEAMISCESLRLPDCLGVRQRWLREAVGLALKCTIFTKYKENYSERWILDVDSLRTHYTSTCIHYDHTHSDYERVDPATAVQGVSSLYFN